MVCLTVVFRGSQGDGARGALDICAVGANYVVGLGVGTKGDAAVFDKIKTQANGYIPWTVV